MAIIFNLLFIHFYWTRQLLLHSLLRQMGWLKSLVIMDMLRLLKLERFARSQLRSYTCHLDRCRNLQAWEECRLPQLALLPLLLILPLRSLPLHLRSHFQDRLAIY